MPATNRRDIATTHTNEGGLIMAGRETVGTVSTESVYEGEADSSTGILALIREQERNRWAVKDGTETAGTLTYQLAGGRYVLVSTYVAEAYRHRGLASTLVAKALDDIRATGRKITIVCPFVGDFIHRNPEYADLIDPVHPGRGASGLAHPAAPAADAASASGSRPASERGSEAGEGLDRIARIMVLGAIAHRGPLSAAGVVTVFDEWDIDRWVTITTGSIAEQFRSLSAAGFIRLAEGRHGEEYDCAEGGRTKLRLLLLELLHVEGFRPFNLMPLLHFVTSLEVSELADGLRRRIIYIDEVLAHKDSVIEHSPADGPDHRSEIVRLDWQRFNADRTWSLEFVGRLYGAGS